MTARARVYTVSDMRNTRPRSAINGHWLSSDRRSWLKKLVQTGRRLRNIKLARNITGINGEVVQVMLKNLQVYYVHDTK